MAGRIVILNGPPRSGKSSIAKAMQARLDGLWINYGVDGLMRMTPEAFRPGIGLRPGGERPDLEPVVRRLYGALFGSIAASARAGIDIVADLGIHDDYSEPLGILPDAVRRLNGLPVLFVGVTAPIDTIMARRNADTENGTYAAGPDVPPPVRRWQDAPHAHGVYDLWIDTSRLSPEAGAAEIEKTLADPPAPSAFERLAKAH